MGMLDDLQTTTAEIDIDSIELAREQVRQEKVGDDLEDLAANIRRIGLIYPVVVARLGASEEDRWELIAGQRRFLAIKTHLKWEKISAKCIDQEVTDEQALAIGASENFLQQRMTSSDWKATCNRIYDIYGKDWKRIHDATGLPVRLIKQYVKGARLAPALKELEQQGYQTDLLIRAQDATEDKGIPNPERALKLVTQLKPLDDDARSQAFKIAKNEPSLPIDKVIERSEEPQPARIRATVTFFGSEAEKLQDYAEQEGANINDAVRGIVASFLQDGVEAE